MKTFRTKMKEKNYDWFFIYEVIFSFLLKKILDKVIVTLSVSLCVTDTQYFYTSYMMLIDSMYEF